jgi:hypothetical protein
LALASALQILFKQKPKTRIPKDREGKKFINLKHCKNCKPELVIWTNNANLNVFPRYLAFKAAQIMDENI